MNKLINNPILWRFLRHNKHRIISLKTTNWNTNNEIGTKLERGFSIRTFKK